MKSPAAARESVGLSLEEAARREGTLSEESIEVRTACTKGCHTHAFASVRWYTFTRSILSASDLIDKRRAKAKETPDRQTDSTRS
jgi:hypothetical protein